MVEYRGQALSDKYYFITNMPADKGVSGGPLIMEKDQNLQIIGLHAKKLSAYLGNFHGVLKLREEMFEEIKDKLVSTLHSYDYSKF